MAENPFEKFGDDLDLTPLDIDPTSDEITEFRKHFWEQLYPIGDEWFTQRDMAKPYWKLDNFVRANHINYTSYSESSGVPPGPGQTNSGTVSGDIPCITMFRFREFSELQIANTSSYALTGGYQTVELELTTAISFRLPMKSAEIYVGTGIDGTFEFASGQLVTTVGKIAVYAPEEFHSEARAIFTQELLLNLQALAPDATFLIRGDHAHVLLPNKFRAAESDAWREVIALVKKVAPVVYRLGIPDSSGTLLTLGKLRTGFRTLKAILLFCSSAAIYLFFRWLTYH